MSSPDVEEADYRLDFVQPIPPGRCQRDSYRQLVCGTILVNSSRHWQTNQLQNRAHGFGQQSKGCEAVAMGTWGSNVTAAWPFQESTPTFAARSYLARIGYPATSNGDRDLRQLLLQAFRDGSTR